MQTQEGEIITSRTMKKIIIIDGGPRKNFNTASMLQQFADGATSVGKEIEVKAVNKQHQLFFKWK